MDDALLYASWSPPHPPAVPERAFVAGNQSTWRRSLSGVQLTLHPLSWGVHPIEVVDLRTTNGYIHASTSSAGSWCATMSPLRRELHDFALDSPAAPSLRVDFYDRLVSCLASARTLNHGIDHSSGSVPYGARYAMITAWSMRADVCTAASSRAG